MFSSGDGEMAVACVVTTERSVEQPMMSRVSATNAAVPMPLTCLAAFLDPLRSRATVCVLVR